MSKSLDEKTIYLLDASGYIYRAYHAVRHLSTRQGLPTNAAFGFANMILKLLSEHNPKHMVMAYDAKGPTFRHEMYAAYKANRPPMPEDLSMQIPYIKRIVEAMNIPAMEVPGYEADDILGTLARAMRDKGFRVFIVTGDKDCKQLVSKGVSIWDPMRDKRVDYESMRETYGLEPSQWVDVMALAGDTSDNVPGVSGVGEKTAVALVKTFGSLDALFENLHEVTRKKLRDSLAHAKDQVLLSRRLVTIDTSVPLPMEPDAFRLAPPDGQALASLFRSLEFRNLQERFSVTADLSKKNYRAILDDEAFEAFIARLDKAKIFALDLETTDKDPMAASIVGVSFALRDDDAVYLPLAHEGSDAVRQLHSESTLKRLKPILEDPRTQKVGHNIKYDWIVLKRANVDLQGLVFDSMVASYLLNPTRRAHNLEAIAAEYLGHRMIPYEEVAGTGKGKKGFQEVSIEDAVPYACEDADMTLMAYRFLEGKLEEGGFKNLFEEIEMPLVPVLVDMEMTGVCVDRKRLEEISTDFEDQLHRFEEKIYAGAGESFNIQSHQQLGRILFEKLGLPIQKKTKKKTGYSTDVEVLTALSMEHELPALVLAYRSLAKLKSTYADALVALIHPESHRIHTSYNQTVTATGRLSSSNPNLQNIPVRTEEGRKIRAAFVPRKGWIMLSADYSQIELRLLAHYSEDPLLLDAFKEDEDIHTRTAAEVFKLFPSMITREMRRQAKVINFGIIYGMGPYRLAKELGISHKMAKTYIEQYFDTYEGVKAFIEKTIAEARTSGRVTTLLGRHRFLPDIVSKNRTAREFAERTAVNTPLQGTAADLIKVAMVRIHRALKVEGLRAKMLLQVHDELVFEMPPQEEVKVRGLVRSLMEGIYTLKVPLKVDVRTGGNWAEAH